MLFVTRAAFVLAVILVVGVATAAAFELERVVGDPCQRDRPFVSWVSKGTRFSLESLSATDATLAREEAQAWTDTTPFTFTEASQRAFCDGGDGVVSMGFADELCDGSTFGANVLAVTLYRFEAASGAMVSAEIVFNPAAAQLNEEASFRHVALHEMGHVLGLAHSDACGGSGANSVMKAVLRRDEPRFTTPGSDDVDGADFLYAERTPTPTPTATPTGPTPTPRPPSGGGGCAAQGGERGNLGAALALCALILLRPPRICAGATRVRRAREIGQN